MYNPRTPTFVPGRGESASAVHAVSHAHSTWHACRHTRRIWPRSSGQQRVARFTRVYQQCGTAIEAMPVGSVLESSVPFHAIHV
jgi:hypothetical protein